MTEEHEVRAGDVVELVDRGERLVVAAVGFRCFWNAGWPCECFPTCGQGEGREFKVVERCDDAAHRNMVRAAGLDRGNDPDPRKSNSRDLIAKSPERYLDMGNPAEVEEFILDYIKVAESAAHRVEAASAEARRALAVVRRVVCARPQTDQGGADAGKS